MNGRHGRAMSGKHSLVPIFLAISLTAAEPAVSQEAGQDDRSRQIIARFEQILEDNPREGTALDRVYGFYAECGTLDERIDQLRANADADSENASPWMLVGLFERRRGRDGPAAEAFQKAEDAAPDDPIASYYLGKTLIAAGRWAEAADAMRRAVEKKPDPTRMLDALQELGRLQRRMGDSEGAMEAWNQLDELFPGDLDVSEQIAETLVQEELFDEALKRYEQLQDKADDAYRKVRYAVAAADLKARMNRRVEAMADYEATLATLRPDTWLFRMVRDRIEDVFRRDGDLAGLARYYEQWIGKHPEDVDAMVRMGRVLAMQGRAAESARWFDSALDLAPRRVDLRLALIDQLVYDRKFDAAVDQYAELDKIDPKNPDYLRQWGLVILRDGSRREAVRRAAAATVWRRLIAARPDDPVTAVQVADLMRQAGDNDEAIALYKKAIELAPDEPQYREYLGHFYHVLERREEALAAWRTMAAGERATASNFHRLSEVLSGFDYLDEALETSAEACRLDARSFDFAFQHAELLLKAGQADAALTQFAEVDGLATEEEQHLAVLDRQIEILESTGRIAEEAARLASQLRKDEAATADRWYRLARYQAAAGAPTEALASVERCLKLEPRSIPAWRLRAEVLDRSGYLDEAVAAHRRLSAIDPAFRTQHLKNLAEMQRRLGRVDDALQAGRDLLAAAPGNPEQYRYYAEMCFDLGRPEDGLEALRKAVRANPSDTDQLRALAAALARQFMTAEAIELYWRALEKSDSLQEKTGIVAELTNLYLRTSQFDRLLERLEQKRREADRRREMTFCIAAAQLESGNRTAAREELESLLAENDRDTDLLDQLSQIAEQEGNLDEAIRYQRELNRLVPGRQGRNRLAQLFLKSGATEQSEAIWSEILMEEKDLHVALDAIDRMRGHRRFATALGIVERLLEREPNNWELLYRRAVLLGHQERFSEATKACREVLALNLDPDEPAAKEKKQAKVTVGSSTRSSKPNTAPWKKRLAAIPSIQAETQVSLGQAANQPQYVVINGQLAMIRGAPHVMRTVLPSGLSGVSFSGAVYRSGYGGGAQTAWAPDDYGEARIGMLAWLARSAAVGFERIAFELHEKAEAEDASVEAIWDAIYLDLLLSRTEPALDLVERLAERNAPGAEATFIDLALRQNAGRQVVNVGGRIMMVNPRQGQPGGSTLSGDRIDRLVECYLKTRNRDDPLHGSVLLQLLAILRAAGRDQQARQLVETVSETTSRPDELYALSQQAINDQDYLAYIDIFERGKEAAGGTTYQAYFSKSQLGARMAPTLDLALRRGATEAACRIAGMYLDFVAEEALRPGGNPRTGSLLATGKPLSLSVRNASSTRVQKVSIDFPTQSRYFDVSDLTFLRGVYETFRTRSSLDPLIEHLGRRAADSQGEAREVTLLVRCYLLWWRKDKEAATTGIRRAVEDDPGSLVLRFCLAEMLALRDANQEAIELLEQMQPVDQQTLARREWMILRAARELDDDERARQACKRLFGLRTSPQEQLSLASDLKALGLDELAEATLQRARKSSRGSASQLVEIMNRYRREKQADKAVEVAHEILQQVSVVAPTPAPRTSSRSSSRNNTSNAARQSALSVLKQFDRLEGLIERTEEQFRQSPDSLLLANTLATYYRAIGRLTQTRKVYERLASAEPADPTARYQLAKCLLQNHVNDKAVEHLKKAFQDDPVLFDRYGMELYQEFQRNGRMSDYTSVLVSLDLKKAQNVNVLVMIVSQLTSNNSTRAKGLEMLDRVWKSFPEHRQTLIGSLAPQQLGESEKALNYMREAFFSKADTAGPHSLTLFERSFPAGSSRGVRQNGYASELLKLAESRKQLDQLVDDLESRLQKNPDWQGGRLLLALAQLRQGKIESAGKAIEKLLDNQADNLGSSALTLIGQEVLRTAELRPLAIRIYEACVDRSATGGVINLGFSHSPGKTLVELYKQEGRKEDARAVLLKLGDPRRSLPATFSLPVQVRVMQASEIARELLDLGFPLDAYRLCRQFENDPAVAMGMPGNSNERRRFNQIVASVKKQLTPEHILQHFTEVSEKDQSAREGGDRADVAALEMLLTVESNSEGTTIESPIEAAFEFAAADTARREKTRAALGRLAEKYPDDYSALTARTLGELIWAEDTEKLEAIGRLQAFLARSPLADVSGNQPANLAQQREAERQLCLWLVARRCLKTPDLAGAGRPIADRVLEAAQRQHDRQLYETLLQEYGTALLASGDLQATEKAWRRLLTIYLRRPVETPKDASIPSVPASEFAKATQLSEQALKTGLHELSALCIRESLAAGLPTMTTSGNPTVYRGTAESVPGDVIEAIERIDRQWQESGLDPQLAYETWLAVFEMASDPSQLFYPCDHLARSNASPSRNLGRVLIGRAKQAGRVEELKKFLAANRERFPALVVSVQLAAETQSDAGDDLDRIAEHLKDQFGWQTSNMALHAVAHAVEREAMIERALPVVELARPQIGGQIVGQITADLRRILSRRALAKGELHDCVEHLAAYRKLEDQAGDGGLDRRRAIEEELLVLADARATAGQCRDALAVLAYFVDGPDAAGSRWWDLARTTALALQRVPSDRRYEVLHETVLPPGDPKRVRAIAFLDPFQSVVSRFTEEPPTGSAPVSGGVSFRQLLVEAAADAGELEELIVEAKEAIAVKVDGADVLLSLGWIAAGQTEPALNDLQRRLRPWEEYLRDRQLISSAENESDDTDRAAPLQEVLAEKHANLAAKTISWSDYLVVRAALSNEQLRPAAARLADRMLTGAAATRGAILWTPLARHLERAHGAGRGASRRLNPALRHWHPVVREPSVRDRMESAETTWEIDHTAHTLWTSELCRSCLLLDYPLTGEFEFSVDLADQGGGAIGYGGVAFDPAEQPEAALIWLTGGRNDQFWVERAQEIAPGTRRLTVRVRPDSVTWIVDDHELFVDRSPEAGCPWLALLARRGSRTRWGKPRIAGNPVIPRQVPLSGGPRLVGWGGSRYQELLPYTLNRGVGGSDLVPDDYDWCWVDGEILGRRRETARENQAVQSVLAYQRPLRDGESIAYSFFYQPGETSVHPALGRTAFLLEEGGVKLHWITDRRTGGLGDNDGGNRLPLSREPSRGPLPLVADEWNEVQLALTEGTVKIQLNGTPIVEHRLRDDNSRRFGLFHYQNATAARVRDVVLSGNWPERLPEKLMQQAGERDG